MANLSTTMLRVSLIVLCLGGCAGKKTVQTPEELTAAANQGGPWFCQPGSGSQGWECDNDPEKVANPVPDRKPQLPPPPILPSLAELPTTTQAATVNNDIEVTTPNAATWQDASAELLAQPANHYTVQLAAMSSGTDVAQYLAQLDTPDLSVAPIDQDWERMYVLLLGTFDSFSAAEAASAALPDALSQFEPWIRRLGPLQAAILRGQQVAP